MALHSETTTTMADDADWWKLTTENLSNLEYEQMIIEVLYPSPFEMAYAVLFAAMFIVGVVGNLLVVFVVGRNPSMVGD